MMSSTIKDALLERRPHVGKRISTYTQTSKDQTREHRPAFSLPPPFFAKGAIF